MSAKTKRQAGLGSAYEDAATANEEERNRREAENAPKPFDEALLTPDGLIGDIARHIRASAIIERPQFALAAALAAGATMLGGGVWDAISGKALNLYTLALCAAAGGKDDPLDAASEILREVGLEGAVLPPPASGAGLTDSVITHPVGLLALDEAGDFMSKMLGGGRPEPHLAEMRKVIKELYSRSKRGGRFYQTQRARDNNNQIKEARFVVSPSISLYLTSAPNRIANALTSDEVKDGFIPRFLVFVEEGSKRIDLRTKHTPIPPELIEKLKAARRALGWGGKIGNEPPELLLETTEPAMDIFQRMEDNYRRPKDELCSQGDYASGVWGRCVENARRVAGVVECFRHPSKPLIDEYSAGYGCALLERLCANSERFVRGKIADDPFNQQVLKVRDTFKHYGKTEGEKLYKIPRWLLSKNARLKTDELDAVLKFMEEAREIDNEEVDTGTKKGRVYWLTTGGE